MTATSARAETGRAFASPEACRGSGFFSASDCASAFVHAADLVRERAPHFADRIECVLSFKLCDRQDGSYLPSMLGVEMRNGPGGTVALPMLAVVTPRGLFRDPAQNPAAQDPVMEDPVMEDPEVQYTATRVVTPKPRKTRSQFGDLLVDASILVPSGPPTLAKYRRVIEASRLLRLAARTEVADAPALGRPSDR